jgi:hypothetical protein
MQIGQVPHILMHIVKYIQVTLDYFQNHPIFTFSSSSGEVSRIYFRANI